VVKNFVKNYTFDELNPGVEYVFKVIGRSCIYQGAQCLESRPSVKHYVMVLDSPVLEVTDFSDKSINLKWGVSEADTIIIKYRTGRNSWIES
jgi:hypothetical protein